MGLSFSTIPGCISCNREIQDALYDSTFLPNLFTIIIGFIILGLIVFAFSYFSFKKYKRHAAFNSDKVLLNPVPLSTTSIILGIGIGGFIDGILFHQILQLHGMVSNKLPIDTVVGKAVNMFWDGIFHFFCLLVVVLGIVLLWKLLFKTNIDRSGKLLSGGLLLGWGLFNIVEGVIDHHLLALHNVIELAPNHGPGNITFLGISVLMVLVGYLLIRHRTNQSTISTDIKLS